MQAKRRSLTNLFHHLNINWVTEQETYIQLQISSNLMIAILLDIIIVAHIITWYLRKINNFDFI
jgi:hypothetical protein